MPVPAATQLTQHPLLVDPSSQTPAGSHPLSRGFANLTELINTLEDVGGAQAVRALESLVGHTGPGGGTEAIRVGQGQGRPGAIGFSIGGRYFQLPQPAPQSAIPTYLDPTAEYVPAPSIRRWQEEMSICPGSDTMVARIVVHIINRLLPEARRAAASEAARIQIGEDVPDISSREAAPTHIPSPDVRETRAGGPRTANLPSLDNIPAALHFVADQDVEMGM
jgi:E3 ubiquitin-protein ligase HUWE1